MNPADAENTTKLNASQESWPILLNETELVLELGLRQTMWVNGAGRTILLADYRVGGEVWQVHKNDADPYPSRPHAHCISGPARLRGCTLHLGTAELFRGRQGLNRYLAQRQFDALIDRIRPKFPGITLPLPATA
ncbi:hypothetical protein [Achromobacter sp. 2789STDY5608615]|uniref:hypothetical protein n=1 Tax=Achromobacter sp. 2789STDY5608615 TaxID=1806492 RepID=UPI0012E26EF6|nr:hypothetical protein [Achromobacter sp. 2789STDY5608615]